jgi:5-amino-6-(5-phosphoribosylamino)uracil reductase
MRDRPDVGGSALASVQVAPYVVASCAAALDGATDDPRGDRLILSGAADLDAVDDLRAGCDAVLVGAGTVRRDNPRLQVRSARRRAERVARGSPASPLRVVVSTGGQLDPSAAAFAPVPGSDSVPGHGAGPAPVPAPTLVYCAEGSAAAARARLGAAASVVGIGDPPDLGTLLADLAARGIHRLLVEGGTAVRTAFLAAGLVDELRLAVAPFLVGASGAPRVVGPATFPHGAANRMTLVDARPLGDMVVARYLLDGAGGAKTPDVDRRWLRFATELSRASPPSTSAFSVGAAVVGEDGTLLATGYSREQEPHDHAEEVALRGLPAGVPLAGATIYSSLEPCSARASRPRTCSELILAAGIGRVVFAWREPELFVDCHGAEDMRAAGLDVVERTDLAPAVRAVNAHLLR